MNIYGEDCGLVVLMTLDCQRIPFFLLQRSDNDHQMFYPTHASANYTTHQGRSVI
jgi:hypothetical protein